jgi:hypothetical protein
MVRSCFSISGFSQSWKWLPRLHSSSGLVPLSVGDKDMTEKNIADLIAILEYNDAAIKTMTTILQTMDMRITILKNRVGFLESELKSLKKEEVIDHHDDDGDYHEREFIRLSDAYDESKSDDIPF